MNRTKKNTTRKTSPKTVETSKVKLSLVQQNILTFACNNGGIAREGFSIVGITRYPTRSINGLIDMKLLKGTTNKARPTVAGKAHVSTICSPVHTRV